MATTVGIIQPNYLPWRGYFDFMHEVDVFVFLDDVQYTKNDWRNRNRVRIRSGDSVWLTVPVARDGKVEIRHARIDASRDWARRHLRTLRDNYGGAPGFAGFFPMLEEALSRPPERLADLTIDLTTRIARHLGIGTRLVRSSDFGLDAPPNERLIEIVQALGGSRYLSGPSARGYLRPELWVAAGIDLAFKSYEGYPAYPQISLPFDPLVSVVDLIFMTGDAAPDHIWGRFRTRA